MSDPAVVCYGEIGVDNIIQVPFLPSPERAAFPTQDSHHIGGAAANSAVWLAAWGVSTRLVGNAIGEDDFGRSLRTWLEAYPSLDLEFLKTRSSDTTPFCRILVTPDGERTILVYGYPESNVTSLTPALLDGAKILALDLYGGEERVDGARIAFEAGLTTLVNDVVEAEHPVLAHSSIVINSAAYIRSAHPGVEPVSHARRLREVSNGIVITTDGPNRVMAIDADGEELWVQPPDIAAVDTTGAGDAFRAGLIFGLLRDWPLQRAVAWGAAAGAEKVKRLGGGSDPAPLEDVEELAAGILATRELG